MSANRPHYGSREVPPSNNDSGNRTTLRIFRFFHFLGDFRRPMLRFRYSSAECDSRHRCERRIFRPTNEGALSLRRDILLRAIPAELRSTPAECRAFAGCSRSLRWRERFCWDSHLYVSPSSSGEHTIVPENAKSGAIQQQVRIISLQDVRDIVGQPIDMMKADCEGAEGPILFALQDKSIPVILYEITPKAYDPTKLKNHLIRLGYHWAWRHGLGVATTRSRELT